MWRGMSEDDPFAAVRAQCARSSAIPKGPQRAPTGVGSGYGLYTQALWRLVAGMVHAGRLPVLFLDALLRDGAARGPAAGLYGLSPEFMAGASVAIETAVALAVAHGLVVPSGRVLRLPTAATFLDRVTRASRGGVLEHLPGFRHVLNAATREVRAQRISPKPVLCSRVSCVVEDTRTHVGHTSVGFVPLVEIDSEWEEA